MVVLSLISFLLVKIYQIEDVDIEEEQLTIVTSFYPMYIATLNIVDGVQEVEVSNLTENQTGCVHDYQLTTEDMRCINQADIAVINGGDMEIFLEDVLSSRPEIKVIRASEGLQLLEGHSHTHEEEEHEDEDHEDSHEEVHEEVHEEEEHKHEHGGVNGHVWMNMNLYQEQIATIALRLSEYDPEHALIYQANAERYLEDIKALQLEYKQLEELTRGQEIIIFHDAFAYFAQQYGMEVVHIVNTDSESALSAGEIAGVIDEIRLHHVQYLLSEEQYQPEIANRIATETNAKVYVLNSLVTGKDDKDSYLNGMRQNLEELKTMFQ